MGGWVGMCARTQASGRVLLQLCACYWHYTTLCIHASCKVRTPFTRSKLFVLCHMQASFEGNRAGVIGGDGGAIYTFPCILSGFGCTAPTTTVTLTGPTTFLDNVAEKGKGGALVVSAGVYVFVLGELCAQKNSAPTVSGGFAAVDSGATLIFAYPAIASMADNSPDTMTVDGNVTTQGVGSWVPAQYTITGPVGPCSAAFAAGNTSCNGCSAVGTWNSTRCLCKGRRHDATATA